MPVYRSVAGAVLSIRILIFFKMKSIKLKNRHAGFSLIEILIAIAVFALIMTTVIMIFTNVASSRKKARVMQISVEDAGSLMDLMTKSLRMSSVISINGANNTLIAHDYSREKCMRYDASVSNNFVIAIADWNDTTKTCGSFSQYKTSENVNSATFAVIPSVASPKKVGRITIAMKVCYNGNCSGLNGYSETIQTTVSLRDYNEVGI